jgi:hypothetical protein
MKSPSHDPSKEFRRRHNWLKATRRHLPALLNEVLLESQRFKGVSNSADVLLALLLHGGIAGGVPGGQLDGVVGGVTGGS